MTPASTGSVGRDWRSRKIFNRSGCRLRASSRSCTQDENTFADINELTLRVRCGDGFVAHLNGQEEARRDFTDAPSRNSKVDSAVEFDVQGFDEYIDISPSLGRSKAGANILAIHGMNSGSISSVSLTAAALDAVLVTAGNRSI